MNNSDDFHDLLGRIGPFAIIDIVGTIVGIEILIWIASQQLTITPIFRMLAYILGFASGVLAHQLVNVSTPLNRVLLGNPQFRASFV